MEKHGCVYFMKHKDINPIKIGYTNEKNPKRRLHQMKTFAPYGVELIGFIFSENARELEKKLHKKYSDYRINGEWFNINICEVKNELSLLSQEVVVEIKNTTKIMNLYNSGFNVGYISNDLGFSIQYVYRIIKRNTL